MPIRLIAIDLDGTLLDSQSQISDANRQAVSDAAARGVQVVIVTGRRFHSARPFFTQLSCPVTVISSNGARIATSSGEVLYQNFLPSAVAREVLKTAHDYRAYAVAIFDVPGRGQVTMHEDASLDGPLGWYLKSAPDCLAQVADFGSAIAEDPIQVLFGGPPARITPLEPLIEESTARPFIHLTWTKYPARDTYLLDVMNKGCTKGSTLELWARRAGIERHEVMALGDNFNDVEMLEYAGRAVVMGNAEPDLARDGWTVTRSNDEHGVAHAIQSYVLDGE
ncbi:MAG TPA: Cof-type HAD-IIB family hydrolase [Terriglobia bacterium]|nr:Cof-type HAD-IIB family hydrolase [Terriglobia bacterium]